MFQMAIKNVLKHNFKDERNAALLKLLIQIYALNELASDNTLLYEAEFFGPGSVGLLQSSLNACLKEVRPHLVSLAETGDIIQMEDFWNVSTIGNKYGDIYDTQLKVAENGRLNTGKPPAFYEKLMRPLMNGGHAKL